MKIQVPAIELPASVPTPAQTFNAPVVEPTFPAVPGKKPPGPEPEPEVLQLKDSKFVRVTAKELKNQQLPSYLQLELDLNPLKEGETISADRDSSIRHAGKP